MEIADYFTKEYNDEREMLKLLYQSMRALASGKINRELVRYIYELKTLVINGEAPEVYRCANCGVSDRSMVFSSQNHGLICSECEGIAPDGIHVGGATLYTLQYIVSSTIEKLYTFTVSDEVLKELGTVLRQYTATHIDKNFKSLEILEMCLK
jgi:DNA repair protein RecO (recombination protein O)